MGQQAGKNDKTERVTGLGRKTREETVKWNQMTALSFQIGGRYQTSPASLPRLYQKTRRNPDKSFFKIMQPSSFDSDLCLMASM